MNGQNWRAERERITILLSKTVEGIQVHRWGRRICLGLSDFEKEDGKINPFAALIKAELPLPYWDSRSICRDGEGRIIAESSSD